MPRPKFRKWLSRRRKQRLCRPACPLWTLSGAKKCHDFEVVSVNEKWKTRLATAWEWTRLFFYGASFDKRMGVVRKEANDVNDEVLLLLFGDLLGIPNPLSYYMMELLPYVAGDLPGWERRMMNREMIMAEKAGQYGFDG